MLKSSIGSYESIQNNLPKGWIKTRIKETCKTKSGGTPSRKNPNYFGGKIPWIKSGELNDSVIYSYAETITKLGLEKSNAVLYPKNTVLLAMYGATIGKISILGISASTNQAICAFYHNEKIITNLYLFWFLKSIRKNLLDIGFGGAQKNISQEKIKQIWILLPPLNEQNRIVSKIESIFSRIDAKKIQLEALVSQIKSASSNLSALKSSILKQAFEGKLVPQDPDDESAEILLRQIHKKSKITFKSNNLPKGWIQAKLSHLAIINPKPEKNSIDPKLEVSFVPMRCVEALSGRINLSNTRKFEDVRKGYTYFQNHDIIFAKITPCMENGKIAIPDGLKNGIGYGSTEFHVIRLTDPKMSRKFYFYYFIQTDFRKKAESKMKGTAGQLRVPTDVLSKELVPIPPLNEQKRIVSKIESIFDKIDAKQKKLAEMELQLKSIPDSVDALKRSILKLAFEGKLVPQDPNDEPASILLERIKSQQSKRASNT